MPEDSSSPQDRIEQILYGSSGVKVAEAAIQNALKTFMEATATQVEVLVRNNTLYPEMRNEMLKLEKNVMEMTMLAIDSIQSTVPRPNRKDKS